MMAIVYEVKFNSLNTTVELELFRNGDTDSLCESKKNIQTCFRHQIGNVFNKSTPIMIYHILDTHNELFERTKNINGISDELLYDYTKNWNIILDNLSSFYLSTDRLHFFQILILPIIKAHISSTLKNSKQEIQEIKTKNKLQYSEATLKEINKFMKYEVNLLKGQ
jgi:hypothetical protein